MSGSPIDRRFEAVVMDWDGTVVPDRRSDASEVRAVIESATELGLHIGIVSGTHLANVDEQLMARPAGPGSLHLCLNRGSEVFRVGARGPRLVWRRRPSADENQLLDAAADAAVDALTARGLTVRLVSRRLNRRKLDLIPEAAWSDPPKAAIADLLGAVTSRLHAAGISDLREAVRVVRAAAVEAGLPSPCVTSDAKHIEVGLTDKSDSARWLAGHLWACGVHPPGVLVVGDEFGSLGGTPGSDALMMVPELAGAAVVSVGSEPEGAPGRVMALHGGPALCLELLRDQLGRRRAGELPTPPLTVGWTLDVNDASSLHPAAAAAVCALGDGIVGSVGFAGDQSPAVLMQGRYVGHGPETELLQLPIWQVLAGMPAARGVRRTLDLRTGVLWYTAQDADGARAAVAFQSRARAATGVLRQEVGALRGSAPVLVEPSDTRVPGTHRGDRAGMTVENAGCAVAARATRLRGASGATADSYAVYRGADQRALAGRNAAAALRRARAAGFDRLLNEHREAWAARWADADISIDAPGDLQARVRFALYHLMSSAPSAGEAAIAARGLSGEGYRGHVFWDADVFVLPFLAATHPQSARAMLEYRIRRLDAARRRATADGRRGARFPWESAATGDDVTPRRARNPITGRTVSIRTGDLEEHIVSDVAWAANRYVEWTGDEAFWLEGGADLVAEAARYWVSRVREDGDGRAHIDRVIGPDEYHVPVDDNAFTNVMARWTLRRAAALPAAARVKDVERDRWCQLADALVDGYRPTDGLYEQFAGFSGLEPLIIRDVAPRRPIAADLLLGPDRVAGAQVIKQADVLMLHYLVPEEVAPGSLVPNLEHYEPRTAHGSSLSLGVHASLLARAGRLESALSALELVARIDVDDLTGTTASGLHLAAMGTVWNAVTQGMLGLRATERCLEVDPHLPSQWRSVRGHVRYRGARIDVEAFPGGVRVSADQPTPVSVGDMPAVTVTKRWTVVPVVHPLRESGSDPMTRAIDRSTLRS
ncbi:MAG TPA: glycosyl hydrolase family 65 protein [Gaiellales bacterium]|nr:glycosyl hydrolase family 65 protein [Gaiellales bacterium]